MRRPIGLYLAEFRSDPAPALVPDDGDLAALARGDLVALPALIHTGVPDEVEAVPTPVENQDDAPAEPAPDLSEIVAALQADHAVAMTEARAQWAAREGEALARGLSDALHALEARVADALAPLVEPFLVRAAQLTALDGLREAIGTLLAADAPDPIRVSGPADLLAALEAAHSGEPRLAYAVAETPDVTVTLGDTTIRSRLQAWASTLQNSLGDGS